MSDNQPREKLLRHGAAHLRDIELIAILLSSGNAQSGVKELARKVLKLLDHDFSGTGLASLMGIKGVGLAKACTILAAIEFSRRRFRPTPRKISSAEDVFRCVAHLADRQENFISLTLNGAGELLQTRIITRGLLNRTLVHPREVFADAIVDRAASVIIAHNHPSGELSPSEEDLRATQVIAEAGQLIGIELSDHVIFNHNFYFSLEEHGYL